MKKTKVAVLFHALQAVVFTLLAFFYGVVIAQEEPLAEVKSYGQHIGSNIVYNYSVTNHGTSNITVVAIGCHCIFGDVNSSFIDKPELTAFPIGHDYIEQTTSPSSYTAPAGWTGKMMFMEETDRHWFEWSPYDKGLGRIPDNALVIEPGQTFQFGITVPKEQLTLPKGEEDRAYLTGHFFVYFGDGKPNFSDTMQLADTTPPTLSVSLTPATLWPPNGKPVPITATVTVKDDYDPNPEIKLEAITANEPLLSGDITDAQYGTDDRRVVLNAKRNGQSTLGRIYTLTYTATDASGNKATASATVTVPHDQGK